MAMNFVPLDKNTHQSLKVSVKPNFDFAKDAHIAAATVREFAQLASSMPIVFIKDPKDSFVCVAMLGLEANQNMFLHDGKWQAPHVPLNILRYPFDVRPDGEMLGMFIDENSPLITEDGEPLFDGDEPSAFLKNRQALLTELANSERLTVRFATELKELDLLEEMNIRVAYQNGEKRNLTGIYSINEKKLNDLSDEKILEMHKNGFVGAAYTQLISMGQLNRLVELSNKTDKPIQSMQLVRAEQENAESQTASDA